MHASALQVHVPFCVGADGKSLVPEYQLDVMWRRAEDLLYAGKVRSLGVCNFSVLQLEALLDTCEVRPVPPTQPWAVCAVCAVSWRVPQRRMPGLRSGAAVRCSRRLRV